MENSGKISSALFGLVAFCFFLPFMTFSCAGSEVHLSGMQTTFGTTIETTTLFGQKQEIKQAEGQVNAMIALTCAVAGILLGLLQLKQGPVGSIAAGGVGACFLFLLKSKVERETLEESGGLVQVAFDFGFWLALLGFVAAVAFNAYRLSEEKKGVPKTSGLAGETGWPAVGAGQHR